MAAAILGSVGTLPAEAVPLIGFTDNAPAQAVAGSVSDVEFHWAVSWTQSVASAEVTLRVLIDGNNLETAEASWWITDRIGPGTQEPDDVVYAGSYTVQDIPTPLTVDFNGAPRTTFATGLSFAPGTYYLVIAGPPGVPRAFAQWLGDLAAEVDVDLAPGFALGTYSSASAFTGTVDAFGPASTFSPDPDGFALVFELESAAAIPVAEPSAGLLLAAGFFALVWSTRRSARVPMRSRRD